MQLFLFYIVAIAMLLTGEVSANRAEHQTILLHYKGLQNQEEWTRGAYGACLPIIMGQHQKLDRIWFPIRSICQHYEDANCKHKSQFPPNIHYRGYAVPARNYGYGKCQILAE